MGKAAFSLYWAPRRVKIRNCSIARHTQMPVSGAPEERGCDPGFTLYNLVDNCVFRVATEDQRRAAARAFDQALGSFRKFSIAWYWPGAKRPRRSAVRATS